MGIYLVKVKLNNVAHSIFKYYIGTYLFKRELQIFCYRFFYNNT